MATFQAVNVLTGTTEGAKLNATGITQEVWRAAVTTALASGDTISGPVIPAGTYVTDVTIGITDIDSATSFTFKAGVSGSLATFIKDGNTTGRADGIARMDVAAGLGYTSTSDQTLLVTITATAGTPVAGTVTMSLGYTQSP